ncbi:MAG: T9SS type A sorting domain-containing protein [Ignavibacteriae bacterium]|nr:T9SS type A sorting domain-containing protein [Ignavibacteriota bacterium]
MRTTEGGVTWANQRKQYKWGLTSVEFVDALNGWTGGSYGPLLRTTNGGTNWYSMGFTLSSISRLRFLAPFNGWAATENGGVLRSFNAGANWDSSFQWPLEFDQDIWVPPGPVTGLSVVDSTTAWLIGERVFRREVPGFGNIIARTQNAGQTWDTVRINFRGRATDICFITRTRGWYLTDSASIIGTTDGGFTWQHEFGPIPSSPEPLRDLFGLGTSHVWAVGVGGMLVRTTDAGATWHATTVDSTAQLQSVAFVDQLNGWCGGARGEIFRTSDGGTTWTKLSRGSPHYFRAVEFTTPQKGWAASGWTEDVKLLHSTDGGYSWTAQLSSSGGYFIDVEMIDTLLGWAVGSITPPQKLFRTTNGGSTWEAQPLALTNFVHGVVFADPDHGWIYGDYIGSPGPEYQVVHRTTNGGQTWAAVLLDTSAYSPTVPDLCALDSLTAWCVNQYGVFRTMDGGASWQHIFHDTPLSYKSSITFVNPSHGWIAGSGGLVMHTTDGGVSWQQQTSGTNEQLQCIRFADLQRGWAVGLGIMIRTTNGGQMWLRDTVETYPYMFDLSLLAHGNTLHAWAVGFSGSVFKHESPLTGVKEEAISSAPLGFALYQNYPNPFNPKTSFRFKVSGSKLVTLKVYDVLGREVATLVNGVYPVNGVKEPGTYEAEWDASGFASGIYLYRLTSGAFTAVRKMVLIR